MPPHSASRSSTGTLNDKASSAIIVGGGIGGLAAALTLHAKGFRSIKVVEKSRYLNPEVGAGLNLQPHAVGILQELGVGEAVTAQGVAITSQSYFTAAGARVAEVPRGLAADPEGFPQIAMHRGRLHATLFGAVEQRLGKDTFIRGLKVGRAGPLLQFPLPPAS